MLKFKSVVLGVVAGLILPAAAFAQCEAPKAPDLPKNGAVLTSEQLNSAADMVGAYSQASQEYRSCLDKMIHNPKSRTQLQGALDAEKASGEAAAKVWDAYSKLSKDWVAAHQIKKTEGTQ